MERRRASNGSPPRSNGSRPRRRRRPIGSPRPPMCGTASGARGAGARRACRSTSCTGSTRRRQRCEAIARGSRGRGGARHAAVGRARDGQIGAGARLPWPMCRRDDPQALALVQVAPGALPDLSRAGRRTGAASRAFLLFIDDLGFGADGRAEMLALRSLLDGGVAPASCPCPPCGDRKPPRHRRAGGYLRRDPRTRRTRRRAGAGRPLRAVAGLPPGGQGHLPRDPRRLRRRRLASASTPRRRWPSRSSAATAQAAPRCNSPRNWPDAPG